MAEPAQGAAHAAPAGPSATAPHDAPAQAPAQAGNDAPPDAMQQLEAWQACGADRLDPVRFRLMQALARRAALHQGAARRVLDDKLAARLSAYRLALEAAGTKAAASTDSIPSSTPGTAAAAPPAAPRLPARGALAALADQLAGRARARSTAEPPATASARIATPARPPVPAEPELIDYFRDTWTRVSANQRVQQSLQQVPEHAGPLNSHYLIHRSLTLMQELSPEYLHQFLSYVDALTLLEQMQRVDAAPAAEAPAGAVVRKKTRAKAR